MDSDYSLLLGTDFFGYYRSEIGNILNCVAVTGNEKGREGEGLFSQDGEGLCGVFIAPCEESHIFYHCIPGV